MEPTSHHHYVPILKAKAGERRALRGIAEESQKERLTPLLEAVEETDALSLGGDLARDWGVTHPIMLDARALGDHAVEEQGAAEPSLELDGVSEAARDPRSPLLRICADYGRLGGRVIPVVSISSTSAEYLEAAVAVARHSEAGLCLRLEDEDFGPTLREEVQRLLTRAATEASEVHLLLDLREVSGRQVHRSAFAVIGALELLPSIDAWRSLTVAGSSFPYTTPKGEGIHPITRVEWSLWQQLIDGGALKRLPAFGDYAIQNPEVVRVEGTDKMILAPTLRYASDSCWFVFKGRKPRVESPQDVQMREICKRILDHPAFSDLSWGDRWIQDRAAGVGGTGGATEWRAIGTSRHLAVVTSELAKRFGS